MLEAIKGGTLEEAKKIVEESVTFKVTDSKGFVITEFFDGFPSRLVHRMKPKNAKKPVWIEETTRHPYVKVWIENRTNCKARPVRVETESR